jgi:hypothetical protein
MQVRRTGAQKGCSPIFYVQANTNDERLAMRAGLIEEDEQALPYFYVLAWGFESKAAAEQEMERLELMMKEALGQVEEMKHSTVRRGRWTGPTDGPVGK